MKFHTCFKKNYPTNLLVNNGNPCQIHNNPKQNLELVVCVYATCVGHVVGIPSLLQSIN